MSRFRIGLLVAAALALALLGLVAFALARPEGDTYTNVLDVEAFERLPKGVGPAEAEAALGQPLAVVCEPDGGQVWLYSERATGAERFVELFLRFGRDGVLIEKVAEEVSDERAWAGPREHFPFPGGRAANSCGQGAGGTRPAVPPDAAAP